MAHCLNCDLIKNPKSLSSSIVCQDGKIFFRFIDNANEYFIIFSQSYQVFRVTQHYPTWTRTPWLFSRNTQRKLFSKYKPLTKVFNLLVKTVYDKFGKIANVTPRVALTSFEFWHDFAYMHPATEKIVPLSPDLVHPVVHYLFIFIYF